jgi:hypothetical protein
MELIAFRQQAFGVGIITGPGRQVGSVRERAGVRMSVDYFIYSLHMM